MDEQGNCDRNQAYIEKDFIAGIDKRIKNNGAKGKQLESQVSGDEMLNIKAVSYKKHCSQCTGHPM